MRRLFSTTTSLTFAILSSACELTKTTLVEPLPNVVVEAYARVLPTGGGTIFALLHGSVGVTSATPGGPQAVIRVQGEDGSIVELSEASDGVCAYGDTPTADPRRCYAAELPQAFVRPSQRLTIQIDVMGGGRIEGGTQVPGTFGWASPSGPSGDPAACVAAAGPLDLVWTPSEGAWAYIADAMVHGVAAPLGQLGVTEAVDSVALFGITVSRADTAIAFPEDFSIDDPVPYELPLTTVLEGGLQSGMAARTTVQSVDRNFTNWVRDQVFNPSGVVRIPSLRGEGTGVFGSSVVLERWIAADAAGCVGRVAVEARTESHPTLFTPSRTDPTPSP